jgi:hypothetical protein
MRLTGPLLTELWSFTIALTSSTVIAHLLCGAFVLSLLVISRTTFVMKSSATGMSFTLSANLNAAIWDSMAEADDYVV